MDLLLGNDREEDNETISASRKQLVNVQIYTDVTQ
jgi:hypothetical protein